MEIFAFRYELPIILFLEVVYFMKISVLIIAHNEEKHIVECLHSIVHQTLIPQEIVLVAHNCTDRTIEYAKKFPNIKIISYLSEERWPLYARIRGFQEVWWDIIACIDGDAIADKNWLQEVVKPFQNQKVVATGGYVWFFENSKIFSISFLFFTLKLWRPWYFWWANFCVRSSAFRKVSWFTHLEKNWKKIWLFIYKW